MLVSNCLPVIRRQIREEEEEGPKRWIPTGGLWTVVVVVVVAPSTSDLATNDLWPTLWGLEEKRELVWWPLVAHVAGPLISGVKIPPHLHIELPYLFSSHNATVCERVH